MIEPKTLLESTPLYLLNIYYLIVSIGAVYIYINFRKEKLIFLVILIFWQGLFNHIDNLIPNFFNAYKIIVFFYTLLLFMPKIKKNKVKHDFYINLFFILFSVSFWISCIINKTPVITSLSQYTFKYGITFLFYYGIKDIIINEKRRNSVLRLLYTIIILQIFFSIVKFSILGQKESIVGSINLSGGGTAVFLPILGMFLIWLKNDGRLRRKEMWFLLLLFVIPLVSGKRAPVILMPLYLFLLTFIFSRGLRPINNLKYITVGLLFLYIGVKTIPSLNKEASYWGSFDMGYVLDYALKYNFGTKKLDQINQQAYQGRGGSLFLIFDTQSLDLDNKKEQFFGKGIDIIALQKRGRFVGGGGYNIEHQGLLSPIAMIMHALGYFGLFFMFLFGLAILNIIRNTKFKCIIISLFLYDFILYGNILLFDNSLAFLILFICMYANSKHFQNKNFPSYLSI